jgi:hypothetical protein
MRVLTSLKDPVGFEMAKQMLYGKGLIFLQLY